MKYVAITLALGSLGAALVAARYWYLSSVVKLEPAWEPKIRGDINENIMGWVTGIMKTVRDAARLNKLAAR